MIETLHLDVEGGVSERRTKPAKGVSEEASKAVSKEVSDRKAGGADTGGSSFVRRRPDTAQAGTAETATKEKPAATGQKKFGGLSSLRQRGLAAAAAAAPSGQAPSQKEYAVEIESGPRKHQHAHARSSAPANRVANTRAEDLEF